MRRPMDDRTLDRMAELLVGFGANVQPGQMVALGSDLGKEDLTRAIARHCYQRGAVFVDVTYADRHLKRARILYAPDEALGDEPAWTVARPRELREKNGAVIGLSGPVDTDLLSDLDPDRLRRDRAPGRHEWIALSTQGLVNWTVGACPTPEWAALVHPQLAQDDALRLLWEQIAHVCRLDSDDPVAAWSERARELSSACGALTGAGFDALHFEGPGTDLTIGLLPSSTWKGASDRSAAGVLYYPNLPTEEVFTAPDPARTEGVARATMPLVLDGTIVRDLVVRFEGGRAVSIEASAGAEALRSRVARDEGAARLGEVALVDGSSRIGALRTVFYDTLLDENAASHIALGNAYPACVQDEADRERANTSEVHVDFMIGSPEVVVTGTRSEGGRVSVLAQGRWAL
jgi:aminopeptidase